MRHLLYHEEAARQSFEPHNGWIEVSKKLLDEKAMELQQPDSTEIPADSFQPLYTTLAFETGNMKRLLWSRESMSSRHSGTA